MITQEDIDNCYGEEGLASVASKLLEERDEALRLAAEYNELKNEAIRKMEAYREYGILLVRGITLDGHRPYETIQQAEKEVDDEASRLLEERKP